jgi:hypothetical protein
MIGGTAGGRVGGPDAGNSGDSGAWVGSGASSAGLGGANSGLALDSTEE